MLVEGASRIIASIREAASGASDPSEILRRLCAVTVKYLACDRVYIRYTRSNGEVISSSWGEVHDGASMKETLLEGVNDLLTFQETTIGQPVFINDTGRSRLSPDFLGELRHLDTRSFAAVPILNDGKLAGWIECHYRRNYHKWRKEDVFILHQIGDYSALYIERAALRVSSEPPSQESSSSHSGEDRLYRERLLEARKQYRRVLEYGNVIIIRTNNRLVVTDVLGDTESILGVSPGDLMNDMSVWSKFLPAKDYRALLRKVRSGEEGKFDLSEEVRVINRKTGGVKWLLVRGIPLFSTDNQFLGWEGFALDITERHVIQDELLSQSKRIEALYDISKSLHVTMDPSVVALRGLRALIKATGSDCGISCLLDGQSGGLELVASEGLSVSDVETIESVLGGNALIRSAIEEKKGLVIENLQRQPQDARFGSLYFLKSAIVMPLLTDGQPRGVMVLFGRKEQRYSEKDFNLASIAAGQICFVLSQAEYYANERRQSDALAFLYRLSHVLSQHSSPREIAEHAFPIVQEEIACKRMWLGVFNEQRTHIVGQAGFGPGMRRHVVRVQVELDLRHDFLDDAIKRKQPIIVKAGQRVECSGLNRILQKLKPGTFVIVPLVSLGQCIGIMVLEPAVSSPLFAQRKLPLLSSMANEIAAVILARKFEAKIADAEKMRMAGLFASGVAHNFNNLLQAVMGQASLIELQVPEGSPAVKSAKMIVDAAGKGAALISQLMSFSTQSNVERKNFPLVKMLRESADLYRSLVGADVSFELDLEDEPLEVSGDYTQLQRVVTNLLVNAKEALSGKGDGVITVSTRKIRVHSGEIDPELAPGLYLRLDVADNGAGMDAERQARCFEPFYTTKYFDSGTGVGYSGSGLGLSSAYSIIKQHEGIITVRSGAGKGAVFSIYLPVARPLVEEIYSSHPTTVSGESNQTPTVPEVVMFGVEPLISSSISGSLQGYGVSSLIEVDKRGVLRFSREATERDALVVLDADKEERGTIELVRALRGENHKVKLVISCVDSRRWSGLIGSLGPMHDIEIVEKSLGVWAIQSTIRRMLGVRTRDANGKSTPLVVETLRVTDESEILDEGGETEEDSVVEPPAEGGR